MSSHATDESERIRRYFAGSGRWGAWAAGRTYLVAERQRLLLHLALAFSDRPLRERRICDVGCGAGEDLAFWTEAGVSPANLAGTELSVDRARLAASRLPAADIRVVDGFGIPFGTQAFDVTTASLVLSTIRDDGLRRQLFDEMVRVTAPDGVVVVYDFRIKRPGNDDVVAMTGSRIARLGRRPDVVWRAAPFLPALSIAIRFPGVLSAAIRLLPRTHAVWLWRMDRR